MDAPGGGFLSQSGRDVVATIAIALGFGLLIVVPAWQLIVPGPFDWHIGLPEVWQGGLEALALIAFCAVGFAARSGAAVVLCVALPSVFFMRRHAVDVPFVLDVVFVESLFALGALVRRAGGSGAAATTEAFLTNLALGICAWSIAAWSVSALGIGSVLDLRYLTLLLAVIAFAFRPTPFAVHVLRRLRPRPRWERAVCGALFAWMLVLFARAGIATGFDSRWYALRPETKLIADGSVFHSFGLVSPVYYFPKLFELLIAPLSSLDNFAVMIGVNVCLLGLVALVCREILSILGTPSRMQWLCAALCVTVPAIANVASVEAKPDTLALLLTLLALAQAMRFAVDAKSVRLYYFLAFALLATQAKLTAIPYVGVLSVAFATLVWRARNRHEIVASGKADTRLARTMLVMACLVAVLVTARTWILVGMPTVGPEALVGLWQALGMSLTPPVATLHWTRAPIWSDVPQLALDELFRPQVLLHIVITWLGNAWLLVLVVAGAGALAARRSVFPPGVTRLAVALCVTGLVLLLGVRYGDRGGDGNYFASALVVAYAFGLVGAWAALARLPRARHALIVGLVAVALFQAAYTFTSGAWNAGTRPFDTDLSRGLRRERKDRWDSIDRAGLLQIADHLRQGPRVRRVGGFVTPLVGFDLPFRFEDFYTVTELRADYFANIDALLNYLATAHIDAIIIPKATAPSDAVVHAQILLPYIDQIEGLDGVEIVDDRDYRLIDFAGVDLLRRHAGVATPSGSLAH